MKLQHKFVTSVPRSLEDGVLYISIEYATAIHKCCCGCETEVVTPFSPTDWKLIFDGETVSLDPSLGNWNLKCQSHYWIKNNVVVWAPKPYRKQITVVKDLDASDKERQFKKMHKKTFFGRLFGKE